MPPRWKFCIAYVNGNLGMAVGALFVEKYFDRQSKQDVSIKKITCRAVDGLSGNVNIASIKKISWTALPFFQHSSPTHPLTYS